MGMAAGGAAGAQTASQITPPTFAPAPQVPGAAVVIPQDRGAEAPAGSESVALRLAGVALANGSPADQAALTSELVGRSVKVADIFRAAHALEVRYARGGHVLTRVIVPPQRLTDGATLRLEVLDGYVEAVDVGRLPGSVRRRIARLLAPLVNARDVTQRRIERRLLLAADTPGVRLRSTLMPGSKPGATVLVVEGTVEPVSGFVSGDNTLPSGLGRYVLGAGLNLNSVLGQGETVYARASGLPSGGDNGAFTGTPRDRTFAAGVILPLGEDGLTFNLEGVEARTAPEHADSQPAFDSRFRRLSARLRYPVVRARDLTVGAGASLDVQDERVQVISPAVLPVSLDALRIVRLSGDATRFAENGGVWSVRAELSLGLDALGARGAADATPTLPLSRQGADADFQKLLVSFAYDRPLARHLALSIRARAQTGFGQALVNAEQVGLASLDGISPAPSGTLQGDAGAVGRAEVQAPFTLTSGDVFTSVAPYAFGAVGSVSFERPTTLERRETGAEAWGAGVRFNGATRDGLRGLSATLEYGVARIDGLAKRPSRLTFTLSTPF